ncbi:XdhC family protein [Streptomyces sp. TRM S81-3]|uniref:XdhC family protein n=1 Tax=Streptomyces griseicoloratus TaxID=2752516 RepID=A0A926QW37_9ACTN|nr:XdhC/CoxI family protein [Streptomyces griseicoloratus]MBD0424732.1 XdhC family protein [Streptomyces griseicoloratus]
MLDIAGDLDRWVRQGHDFAVATIVSVSGSAPREPGAALAVNDEGTAVGSVSGGCVEGAVYELCRQALEDGRSVLERFGYSDETAFAAGLTCGGTINVLVTPVRGGEPARDVLASALSAVCSGETIALARTVGGPAELMGRPLVVRPDGTYEGALGSQVRLTRIAAAEVRAMLEAGRTGMLVVGGDGDGAYCGEPITLLVESSAPPPRLIVFGAIDFASALVRLGRFLGYHVTVCDARPVFATRARFPEADEVITDWPHRYLETTQVDERTVLCVLTHDAKFDVPLLAHALTLPVAYVGAMGSRRTHEDRVTRLREAGVPQRKLDRLRSPIGLDLGARTPEETALSIAAEFVAARYGGTGRPLTGTRTPIHRDTVTAAPFAPQPAEVATARRSA